MAGTTAAAVKAKLVGANGVLRGLTGMESVAVAYTPPLRDIPRELVYAGGIGGPVEPVAMKAGTRVKRLERPQVTLYVRVHKKGQKDCEAGDARAVEIATVIENYLAANYTLGGLANLKAALVDDIRLDQGFIEDDGATSMLAISVACQSFLT
jgi:hypothetical protein